MCVCVLDVHEVLLLNYFPWCNFANAIYQCGIRWWNRCARCHVEKLKLYIYNNRNCEVQCGALFLFWSTSCSFALPLSVTRVLSFIRTNFITLFPEYSGYALKLYIYILWLYHIIICWSILQNVSHDVQASGAVFKFLYTTSTKQRSHRFMWDWLLIKYLYS